MQKLCCLHGQLSSDSLCVAAQTGPNKQLGLPEVPLTTIQVTRCHCLPSSIPATQQQKRWVKTSLVWASDQGLQSKLCNGESHSIKGPMQGWGRMEQVTLETQHCHCWSTLLFADGSSRSLLPMTRKGKGGGGQSASGRWVSGAAGGLLLCNGNSISGVSKLTSYQLLHKYCKV